MNETMKTVYMPIVVPDNNFCWDGKAPCRYFDNEGGHPTCDLGFSIEDDKSSYLVAKPETCLKLRSKPCLTN